MQNSAADTATIEVYLADPTSGRVREPLNRTLVFRGLDDAGAVTFGPVTRGYAAVQTLTDVPLATTRLAVSDPQDPGVLGLARVDVVANRTARVSDPALLPARTDAPAGLGQGPASGAPIAVGAGFVQTRPSADGDAGANNGMAGARATSATTDRDRKSIDLFMVSPTAPRPSAAR